MRRAFLFVTLIVTSIGCGSSDSGSADQSDSGSSKDSAGGGDTSTGGDTTGKDTSTTGDSTTTDSTTTDTTPPGDTKPPVGSAPVIAGCKIFPDDNPWNIPVDTLPISPDAAKYAPNMHTGTSLHPDWGTTTDQYGIPYSSGTGAPSKHMDWSTTWGPGESDKLPCADGSGYEWCYPIPFTAPIEGGPSASTTSDRHVLYLDTAGAPDNCTLYETWNTQNPPDSKGGWDAANGAIFHLGTNTLRTDGWTSADAAGLAILPGLVRYDEVKAGEIKHAIRFTMNNTYNGYIHPATHAAGLSNAAMPPMGLRLRLKKGTTDGLAGISAEAKTILHAMEKYGLLLADNGSNWYISGDTNDGWGSIMSGIVDAFSKVHGGDFEILDTGAVSTAGL